MVPNISQKTYSFILVENEIFAISMHFIKPNSVVHENIPWYLQYFEHLLTKVCDATHWILLWNPKLICFYSATAATVADPTKNLEAREAGLLCVLQKPCLFWNNYGMLFFASLVKCFSATLGCSDCVYDDISIVPTKCISNPLSKSLLRKKLLSLNLGVFRL